jgi:glycosyltransferase involved in cell wall biosynthesis
MVAILQCHVQKVPALYYGKPVIAGNRDGSVDALCNGKFGVLIDPNNQTEITMAIRKIILNKTLYIPDHKMLMDKFSYPVYKRKLETFLEEVA